MGLNEAFSYFFGAIAKLPFLADGLKYYTKGGIGKTVETFKTPATHLDMTNGRDSIFYGFGLNFWYRSLIGLIAVIATFFGNFNNNDILISILGAVADLLFMVFSAVGFLISFILVLFIIYLGLKNLKNWSRTVVKIFIIIAALSVIFNFVFIIKAIIAMVNGDSILINTLIIIESIIVFLTWGLILDGMNKGLPTVDNVTINMDNNSFINQTNNFANNDLNPNIQMYSCPYCGGVMKQGDNPCPHCSKLVNWG